LHKQKQLADIGKLFLFAGGWHAKSRKTSPYGESFVSINQPEPFCKE